MIEIKSARYLGEFRIELEFSDDSLRVFDVQAYRRHRNGPLLDALSDESMVKQFYIEAGALCWPNGLELSPESLYQYKGAA
jgi:hypothetical protein